MRRKQHLQDCSEEIIEHQLATLVSGDSKIVLQLGFKLGMLRDLGRHGFG